MFNNILARDILDAHIIASCDIPVMGHYLGCEKTSQKMGSLGSLILQCRRKKGRTFFI